MYHRRKIRLTIWAIRLNQVVSECMDIIAGGMVMKQTTDPATPGMEPEVLITVTTQNITKAAEDIKAWLLLMTDQAESPAEAYLRDNLTHVCADIRVGADVIAMRIPMRWRKLKK